MFQRTICLTKYNFVFLILLSSVLYGQQTRILTYDESIQIALNRSYTAKSHLENKVAMEHSFNFYKAMFKPRVDLQIFRANHDVFCRGEERNLIPQSTKLTGMRLFPVGSRHKTLRAGRVTCLYSTILSNCTIFITF